MLEADLQHQFISFLRAREWFVKPTHGNMYQQGFPDLFCTHSKYGHRWCEMKVLDHYRFTAAQLETFPKLCANGSGVWVIVAVTDYEYQKLFKKANWWAYLDIMK